MPTSQQKTRPRLADPGERKLTKSERTRAEIVNAAFDFLWSQPYRDLSVNALMDRTGVSRPTFYSPLRTRAFLPHDPLAPATMHQGS